MNAAFEVAIQVLLVASLVRFSDDLSGTHAFEIRNVEEVTRFGEEGFGSFGYQDRLTNDNEPISAVAGSRLIAKLRKVLATELEFAEPPFADDVVFVLVRLGPLVVFIDKPGVSRKQRPLVFTKVACDADERKRFTQDRFSSRFDPVA